MVRVYTRPKCAYCPMVKKFLNYKGIDYEEKQAEGQEYLELLEKHSANTFGTSVPLIVNGDKGMVGYDIPTLLRVVA